MSDVGKNQHKPMPKKLVKNIDLFTLDATSPPKQNLLRPTPQPKPYKPRKLKSPLKRKLAKFVQAKYANELSAGKEVTILIQTKISPYKNTKKKFEIGLEKSPQKPCIDTKRVGRLSLP